MKYGYGWLGALLGAALLAGCGGDPPPDPACPRVAIVSELSRATFFREGGGRDLTDIAAETELSLRASKCTFARNAVDVELDLAIAAASGPADRTRTYDLDYFVAVVDPDRNVTRQETFRVRMQFTNQPRALVLEPISTRIPLPDKARAPGYEVLVGLQLSDEQMAWNRSRRSR
jgi:hypothetical protein